MTAHNRQPFFIDSHCHLEMPAFDADRQEVIQRASDTGVRYIINAGSDLEGNRKGLQISRQHDLVFSSVGIHPHDARSLNDRLMLELAKWIREPKVVAIGEIGLDYYYMHSPKEVQLDAFRRQIGLARESSLPIIVHSRDAAEDTLRVLAEEASGLNGVLHCFSGNREMAQTIIEMGFYISFAGPISFRKAEGLRAVSRIVPDELILIETDAPYLSPVPKRGKRNEPSYLPHTAQALADERGVSRDDIARITSLNAQRLFGVGKIPAEGQIAYQIRDSLYLNITNRCTNRCGFCIRFDTDYVKGHNLKLTQEPSAEKVIKAIGDPTAYKEVVFCGLGEPFLRLDLIKEVASLVKASGGTVRVNTNGHGNVIHGRNILPELAGLIDSLSISLDAENSEKYQDICRPDIDNAFESVLSFIQESKKYIPDVTVTVVSIPGIDIEKCRDITRALGVALRVRTFNVVG